MLKVLICERWSAGPTSIAVRIEASVGDDHAVPWGCEFGVIGIWRLEPGAGESQVQVKGIYIRELKVQAVENVFFVALVVHHDELRRIEEPAAVQAADRDEVSPLWPP